MERNSGRPRSSGEFECLTQNVLSTETPNENYCLFLFATQGANLSNSKFGEKYLSDLYLKLVRYFFEKEIRVVIEKGSAIEKEEMVVRFESVYLPKGMVQMDVFFLIRCRKILNILI